MEGSQGNIIIWAQSFNIIISHIPQNPHSFIAQNVPFPSVWSLKNAFNEEFLHARSYAKKTHISCETPNIRSQITEWSNHNTSGTFKSIQPHFTYLDMPGI